MYSDSSSSDSDSSCEKELDPNVEKAFADMKSAISSFSLQKLVQPGKVTTNHRKIYQTFSKCGSSPRGDKSYSKKKKDSAVRRDIKTSESVNETLNSREPDFFIDKEPVHFVIDKEGSKESGDIDETDVITLDLSHIGDSSKEEVDTKLSYSHKVRAKKKSAKLKKKNQTKKQSSDLSSSLHTTISAADIYLNVDPYHIKPVTDDVHKEKLTQKHKEPEIMKKSVITDDYEKQDSIATTHVSARQLKKQRKIEREKTKGDKWFNMPAPELTDEIKDDLMVLQMRKALDPKRFYKANDLKATPKFFQFGRVVESAADFYHSRVPKKQRKSTIVEELLADVEFRKYNKRKYEEIQEAKRQGQGPYKHMKRLKQRKK